MKRFLSLSGLSDPEISRLLKLSGELERAPVNDSLRGKVVSLLFLNPSLRTLASFQSGIAQLGGSSVPLTPGQGIWGIETRDGTTMDGDAAEHIREAVPVLEEYGDALGVRCFSRGISLGDDLGEPVMSVIDRIAKKPLINLESALDHPCQALADWKTLDDERIPAAGRFVLSWAWHPKALPLAVPAAVVAMAARRGMHVAVLRPEGFGFPAALRDLLDAEAIRGGGTIEETGDRAAALEGAHVVYAKSWGAPEAIGDPARDAALRARHRNWCVEPSWLETTDDAIVMHCLPVRRNVVISDAVLDGPRSRVIPQAGNRLHVQKAVLTMMLGGGSC